MWPQLSIISTLLPSIKSASFLPSLTGHILSSVKEGKKLADLIEGSKVDIIDNCGHMMLLEEADRVLKVLKSFITTHYPSKN